jgi:DNA-binding winged helix-turn-helix (wHTH) protein
MRVRFGGFVFDGEARELRRGGEPVPLPPKTLQLLALLIESRPRAVSKTELVARLWPDTFVVDVNLANRIGEIRAALGEDAREPRFIRTVHGYGYAFQDAMAGAAPTAALYRLTWKDGRVVLGEGEHVLGRDPEAAVCLDAASVSRRHARIRIAGADAILEDLGSKNGTRLDGRRIEGPTSLADGSEVRIGPFRLMVRALRGLASTETVASRE